MDYSKLKLEIQTLKSFYISMNRSDKTSAILDALSLAEELCDYDPYDNDFDPYDDLENGQKFLDMSNKIQSILL